jgi:hypothetical protein
MASRTPFDDRSTDSSSATPLPRELPSRIGQDVPTNAYAGERSSEVSGSRGHEVADDQRRPEVGATGAPKPVQSESPHRQHVLRKLGLAHSYPPFLFAIPRLW